MDSAESRDKVRLKLRCITGAAKRYIQFPVGEIDYNIIAADLTVISGASYAAVNCLPPDKQVSITRGIACSSRILQYVEKLIGHSITGREWPLDSFAVRSFGIKGTSRIGALHEVAKDQIPPAFTRKLESLFKVGDVWSVGLAQGDTVFGNLVMIMPKGAPDPDTDLVDAFSEIVVQLLLRKQSERELRKLLAEKELILRESHHRIKNNLSLIASLVSLQSEQLPEELSEVLTPIASRINAIVLIHEQLHAAGGDGKTVQFNRYLNQLVQELSESLLDDAETVDLLVEEADEAVFEDSTAIPLGIIVTELVMNSIKHAFTDRQQGRISIRFTVSDKSGILTVADDGRGFREHVPEKMGRSSSLGLTLVESLTEQLNGSMKREKGLEGRGVSLTITFPLSRGGSG